MRTILAADLVAKVMALGKVASFAEVGRCRGKELEHSEYHHPFVDRVSPIVLASYVSVEDGTGLVHTAPGHGTEDYQTGRAYQLSVLSPVDPSGRFTDEAPRVAPRPAGLRRQSPDHRTPRKLGPSLPPAAALAQLSALLAVQEAGDLPGDRAVVHRRRSQRPPRPHAQGHRGGPMAAVVGPVADRGDGLAPSRLVHQPPAIVGRADPRARAARPARRQLLDGPDGSPLPRPLPHRRGRRLVHQACGRAGTAGDVLPATAAERRSARRETSSTSGSSRARATAPCSAETSASAIPTFMYLEGSDQHRGWFQSSILTAVGTNGNRPLRDGADAWLRRRRQRREDVEVAGQRGPGGEGHRAVRRRRPAADGRQHGLRRRHPHQRAGHQGDVRGVSQDPQHLPLPAGQPRRLRPVRPGAASTPPPCTRSTFGCSASSTRSFATSRPPTRRFEFYRVYQRIYQFVSVELSSFYLDVLKDRLYAEAAGWSRPRAAQFVLARLHDNLTRLLAPIIPHTAEESWDYLPASPERPQASIWPSSPSRTRGGTIPSATRVGNLARGARDDSRRT